MAKKLFHSGLFVVLTLFAWQLLVAQTPATDINKVISIKIDGNQQISTDEIKGKLTSKPGDTYDRVKVREDIKSLYQMGCFSEVAADADPRKDGIYLTYFVKENPMVADLEFIGNKEIKAKRLKSDLDFRPDTQIYREGMVENYIEKLKAHYKERDFLVDIQGKMVKIDETKVKLVFTIAEEKKAKILSINFEGNKAIKDKKLKKVVSSKNSWLFIHHYYDSFQYDEDIAKIERAYKDKGYVMVDVQKTEPKLIPQKRGVNLQFNINEGPQFSTGTIGVFGNTLFTSSEIASTMVQVPGQSYSQSAMEKDAQRLYDLYSNQGYITTDVIQQLSLDTEARKVNMAYQIKEGSRVYVGNIRFKGISADKDILTPGSKGYSESRLKTQEKVLRREISLETGDVFKKNEVLEGQRRLMNLGYFDRVAPSDEPTLAMDTHDLVYYMMEHKTGSVNFGVGYSTNKKAQIFVDLEETNLFGSGNNLRLKADLAQEGSEYWLTYTQPYFMDTRATITWSLFRDSLDRTLDTNKISYDANGNKVYGESVEHDYEEVQMGGSVGVSYPINADTKATLQVSVKNTKLDPDEDSYELPSALGPKDSWTNSITPGIIYDTRDNYAYPTRGDRYVGTVEIAGEFLGGDNNFAKFYGEGNWYKQIAKNYVTALRLRSGYLQTFGGTDEAPISDRFFLGGPSSMRGFDFRGVSPTLYYIDSKNQEEVKLIVGGEFMLNMNWELRRKLTDRITALIFCDAGGVWEKFEDFDFGEIRYSVGPGVMLNLPIGNFQVGYGVPFNKQEGDDVQKVYFTFGTTF